MSTSEVAPAAEGGADELTAAPATEEQVVLLEEELDEPAPEDWWQHPTPAEGAEEVR